MFFICIYRNCKEALKLMHRATTMPARKVAYHDETETVQMRLYKSLKVWSMYADLEESFGTFKVYHYLLHIHVRMTYDIIFLIMLPIYF